MAEEQSLEAGVQASAPVDVPATTINESEAPAESQKTAPVEKMIPQSQVSKIAAREAREAAERAKAQATAEYEHRIAQMQQQSQPQQAPNMGGIQQQSPDQIRRMIQEEAWNMSKAAQAEMIEKGWKQARDAEIVADPEFADLYDALNIESHPELIIWMKDMDNKMQVVKDIALNPSKYSQILTLANGGSPELARRELNKLSASIRANEDAKQKNSKVNEPLSQITTSNIGGDDGNMSVSDYRAQPWLRG